MSPSFKLSRTKIRKRQARYAAILSPAAGALLLAAHASPARAQFASDHCVTGLALSRAVNDFQVRSGLPGLTVSVFSAEGSIRTAWTGVQNTETGAPITLGDSYSFGSLQKTVTALTIAGLIDEGRLSFDSRLEDLLPDLAPGMSDGFRQVTLRQLLDTSSGAAALNEFDAFESLFALTGPAGEQRRQLAEAILSRDPDFAPGTQEQYSNPAIAIAGLIAERVAGVPYEQLVSERIFGRLGLSVINGIPLDAGPDQPAGHLIDEQGRYVPLTDLSSNIGRTPTALAPAGSLSARVQDWAVLQQEQLRGLAGQPNRLGLSQAVLQELYTPSSPDGSFGPGTAFTVLDGEPAEFFIGSTGAFLSVTALVPGRDAGLVLAANGQDVAPGAEVDISGDLAALTLRALQGPGRPRSADEAAVFSGLDDVCAGARGQESELVALFGELPREDAAALAVALVPDDARVAPRVGAATLEAVADLVGDQASWAGSAARGLPDGREGRWRFGLTGARQDGRIAIGPDGAGADSDTQLIAFSIEAQLSSAIRLGGVAGYGESDLSLPADRGRVEAKGPVAALYVAADFQNGIFLDLASTYADHRVRSERRVATDLIDLGQVDSRRDGWSGGLEGRAGYGLSLGAIRVAPFAGVRRTRTTLGGALEGGGEAALRLSRQTVKETQGQVGVGVGGRWNMGDWNFSTGVDAAYVRSLDYDDEGIEALFDGAAQSVRFDASPRDSRWWDVSARLTVSRKAFSLSLAYGGVIDREANSSPAGSVRLGWRF